MAGSTSTCDEGRTPQPARGSAHKNDTATLSARSKWEHDSSNVGECCRKSSHDETESNDVLRFYLRVRGRPREAEARRCSGAP
jgi:hypothetical protein